MQKFLFYLAENGHDVYSLMHEPKGDPTTKRPEAIEVLLQKIFEVLSDGQRVHLVGDSYGAIDLARVLSEALETEGSSMLDRIASLTLLNPAGLRDKFSLPIISPFLHMSRFLRYVLPAILSKNLIKDPDEVDFLRSWFRLSLQTPLIRTLREVSDITRTEIDGVLAEINDKGIPINIIQSAPDDLLYPNGLCEMLVDRYDIVYGGNHNGPLFNPAKYGGKNVLDAIHSSKRTSSSA